MARYIDADKLLDLIIHKDEEPRYGYLDYFDILHAPTADVKPVVRGEWITNDLGANICSKCGTNFDDDDNADAYRFNYCPDCGADMRGENNGDN